VSLLALGSKTQETQKLCDPIDGEKSLELEESSL
jgi:hypothetical protein